MVKHELMKHIFFPIDFRSGRVIIISSNEKVTIFLSKISEKFRFLVKNHKVEVKILNYHLSVIEKIKLIFFFD